MLKSTNEVVNGLAGYVSGSVSAFAQEVNRRAGQLGCANTNSVNPSGLDNINHITAPHDMAPTMKTYFDHADLRTLDQTTLYHFPTTKKRPNGADITTGHRMIVPDGLGCYPGILNDKADYTSVTGSTLVTCTK